MLLTADFGKLQLTENTTCKTLVRGRALVSVNKPFRDILFSIILTAGIFWQIELKVRYHSGHKYTNANDIYRQYKGFHDPTIFFFNSKITGCRVNKRAPSQHTSLLKDESQFLYYLLLRSKKPVGLVEEIQ